jgi:hypothetical protein
MVGNERDAVLERALCAGDAVWIFPDALASMARGGLSGHGATNAGG